MTGKIILDPRHDFGKQHASISDCREEVLHRFKMLASGNPQQKLLQFPVRQGDHIPPELPLQLVASLLNILLPALLLVPVADLIARL